MLPFDTTRQLVVTEIPSRLVDRTTERGRQSHPILDERVRTAASAIGHRNPQVSACWSAWVAMTGAKPFYVWADVATGAAWGRTTSY